MLKKAVEGEFTRHWKEIEESGKLTGEKLERYIRIRDLKGEESDYADSLKFLSEWPVYLHGPEVRHPHRRV